MTRNQGLQPTVREPRWKGTLQPQPSDARRPGCICTLARGPEPEPPSQPRLVLRQREDTLVYSHQSCAAIGNEHRSCAPLTWPITHIVGGSERYRHGIGPMDDVLSVTEAQQALCGLTHREHSVPSAVSAPSVLVLRLPVGSPEFGQR